MGLYDRLLVSHIRRTDEVSWWVPTGSTDRDKDSQMASAGKLSQTWPAPTTTLTEPYDPINTTNPRCRLLSADPRRFDGPTSSSVVG